MKGWNSATPFSPDSWIWCSLPTCFLWFSECLTKSHPITLFMCTGLFNYLVLCAVQQNILLFVCFVFLAGTEPSNSGPGHLLHGQQDGIEALQLSTPGLCTNEGEHSQTTHKSISHDLRSMQWLLLFWIWRVTLTKNQHNKFSPFPFDLSR